MPESAPLIAEIAGGRAPGASFLPSLGALCGPGITMSRRLDATVTASLRAAALDAAADASRTRHAQWGPDAVAAAEAAFRRLATALPAEPLAWLHAGAATLGAFQTLPALVVPKLPALAQADLGAVVLSLDGTEGLAVAASVSGLDAGCWGPRWRAAFEAATAPAPVAR